MLKAQLNNLPPARFAEGIRSTKEFTILDVRSPQEYAQGHIDNAINIDYLATDFWERIDRLNPDQTFFVYCRSGRRSIRACTLMRNGGFDNNQLFNLDGGYALWLKQMS